MPLLVCPNDGTIMHEINYNDVLIDVCPQCRGVWLDRGELARLLEIVRASAKEGQGHESEEALHGLTRRPSEGASVTSLKNPSL
jgi:uncharacterized protein